MCSACMIISPRASKSALEASRRSLMFGECAARTSSAPISSQAARERAEHDAQLDRVERGHARTSSIVPSPRTRPAPAGRDQQRRLGQRADRRSLDALARRGLADEQRRLDRAAARATSTASGGAREPRGGARRERGRRAPHRRGHGHELDLAAALAVAELALVRRLEALAELGRRPRRPARRPPARRTGRGSASRSGRARRPARRRARRARGRAASAAEAASKEPVASRRGAAAASPSAESTPQARGQRIRAIPSSSAIAVACSGPAPPNGSSA